MKNQFVKKQCLVGSLFIDCHYLLLSLFVVVIICCCHYLLLIVLCCMFHNIVYFCIPAVCQCCWHFSLNSCFLIFPFSHTALSQSVFLSYTVIITHYPHHLLSLFLLKCKRNHSWTQCCHAVSLWLVCFCQGLSQ